MPEHPPVEISVDLANLLNEARVLSGSRARITQTFAEPDGDVVVVLSDEVPTMEYDLALRLYRALGLALEQSVQKSISKGAN